MDNEQMAFTLILHSGNARSLTHEALAMLQDEDLENIRKLVNGLPRVEKCDDFFTEDLFFADKDFKTKQEIIHFLCEALRQKHIVDENYEQLILRREQLAPTAYGGGFAIPHPVKKEAASNMLAVCTLKNPVTWNADRVRVVFLLALSPERDERFDQLFEQLVNLMEDKAKVRALSKAADLSQFMSIFDKEET